LLFYPAGWEIELTYLKGQVEFPASSSPEIHLVLFPKEGTK